MLNNSLTNMVYQIPSKTWDFIIMVNWPVKILLLLLSLLAPISQVIHIIVVFLLLDMLTSIYAQYKEKSERISGVNRSLRFIVLLKTFRSSRARVTLEKAVFYVIAISVVFLFEKYILHVKFDGQIGLFSITNLAALMVAIVELGSIMANISKITNNAVFIGIYKMIVSNVKKKASLDIEKFKEK